jgi:hypothetical protein
VFSEVFEITKTQGVDTNRLSKKNVAGKLFVQNSTVTSTSPAGDAANGWKNVENENNENATR